MTDEDVKRLRFRHIEAARLLGVAEESHERAEMISAAMPHNLLIRFLAWLTRITVRYAQDLESERRTEARKTYE